MFVWEKVIKTRKTSFFNIWRVTGIFIKTSKMILLDFHI